MGLALIEDNCCGPFCCATGITGRFFRSCSKSNNIRQVLKKGCLAGKMAPGGKDLLNPESLGQCTMCLSLRDLEGHLCLCHILPKKEVEAHAGGQSWLEPRHRNGQSSVDAFA